MCLPSRGFDPSIFEEEEKNKEKKELELPEKSDD